MTYRFLPTAVGVVSAGDTFTVNGTSYPVTLRGAGRANAPAPQLRVEPATLDFGGVDLGSSTSRSASIVNAGTTP